MHAVALALTGPREWQQQQQQQQQLQYTFVMLEIIEKPTLIWAKHPTVSTRTATTTTYRTT